MVNNISLEGWDIVSVVSVEAVNKTLNENKRELISLFNFFISELGSNIEVEGKIESWEIIKGGSGNLLRIQLTISSGTMHSLDASISLANLKPMFEISLKLDSTNNETQNLVFSMEHAGKYGDAPKPTFITPIGIEGPEDTLSKMGDSGKFIFLNNFAEYLNQYQSKVSYIFASLNTGLNSQETWLTPIDSEYLYIETLNEKSYLAVLSNVSMKDTSTSSHAIDPALLNDQGDVIFTISRELFLEKIIKPALSSTIEVSPNSIHFDNGNASLKNDSPFYLKSIRVGAINYKPKIKKIEVSIEGEKVRINVDGDCDLKAGISMDFSVDSSSEMTYNNETGEFYFIKDSNPKIVYHTDIPWYLHLIDVVAGPISELILQIVVNEISDSIVDHLKVKLGTNNIKPQVIKWNGFEKFVIKNCQLKGSLIFEGDL